MAVKTKLMIMFTYFMFVGASSLGSGGLRASYVAGTADATTPTVLAVGDGSGFGGLGGRGYGGPGTIPVIGRGPGIAGGIGGHDAALAVIVERSDVTLVRLDAHG